MKLLSGAILALFLLTGCGGGGSTPNPFAGAYSGTWTSAALSDSGTVSMTILASGDATGALTDTGQGLGGGVLLGHVDENGQFTGTSQYPAQAAAGIRGALVSSQNGLIGNMVETFNGVGVAVTFTVTRL